MTRKDYIKLAKAIATIPDDNYRRYVAKVIGDVCLMDNARCDYERWYKACNVER